VNVCLSIVNLSCVCPIRTVQTDNLFIVFC
jgi:hypothetical protein